MKLNSKSIMFKIAIVYIFVTLLNVTIFNVMVWENQTGLIMDNAILNSQHKGSSIKYKIDNIVGQNGDLSTSQINKILKAASELSVKDISLFTESGEIFVAIKNNKRLDKTVADANELRMINMAITKQGFEDKLFYHKVDKKNKSIALYIPFTYQNDKIAVAAIDFEMKDINKMMGYLYKQCIFIALLIIAIHLGFALLFSKMLVIPLKNLLAATQEISNGKLNIRVPVIGEDEMGQLGSSFNEMTVALQRMQSEAKGSNPLTGLPGNISIARYIDDSLIKKNIICVLYCDLDNFKAYNDKYGFTKGDDAIMYTKDCLITVSQRNDVHDIFVGHEGGDDFVVITPFDCWENYAKAFVTTFDRGIYQFYNGQDARNGFIESVNRQGGRQRFPLMSISIAGVTNQNRHFERHAEMIQVAAEVKKYVKGMDGSCYALDRRTGNVSQVPTKPVAGQAATPPPQQTLQTPQPQPQQQQPNTARQSQTANQIIPQEMPSQQTAQQQPLQQPNQNGQVNPDNRQV